MRNKSQSALAQMPILHHFPSVDLPDYHHFTDFHSFSLELSAYTRRIRYVALGFFIAGLLAICTTLSLEIWQLDPTITAENALLELAQFFCLMLATLVQGIRAYNTPNAGLSRDIRTGLALLTCAILLREIDVNKLGDSARWVIIEELLRAAVLLVALGFVVQMVRKIDLITQNLGKILLSPPIIISIFGCILYACGWPFDKELFNIDSNLSIWIEETLELNACILFVCASLANNIEFDTAKNYSPSF